MEDDLEAGSCSVVRTEHEETTPVTSEEAPEGINEKASTALLQRNHSDSVDLDDDLTGRREGRFVWVLRLLLITLLCACLVGVAVAVFRYTSDQEQELFEDRYRDNAEKVLQAIRASLYSSLGALDSFTTDTVAFSQKTSSDEHTNNYTDSSSSPWPFVTLPSFAVRAAKLRSLSRAFIIVQYHAVSAEQRAEWEAYSVANDAWVDEALQIQRNDVHYHGELMDDYTTEGTIYNNWEYNSSSTGPYMASWQSYPMVPIYPPYNWDAFSYSPFVAAADEVLQKAKVVIRCSNLPSPDNQAGVEEAIITNDWASGYLDPTDNPAEPQIEVYYPMTLESKDTVMQQPINGTTTSPHVVGVLAPSIYWRELITGILPSGSGGIDAVFVFGESIFTYRIDGPTATFLGQGDLHDPQYDYLRTSGRLVDLTSGTVNHYSGLPLSSDMANYTIHIYPSRSMQESFETSNPVYNTAIAVLIFAFTSGVFLVYDRCVERRQRKITKTAIQSRENVLLLEKMVHERTKKLEASNAQLEQANRKVVQASEQQLQHFACMSHEIRTPLNCIIGLSSLLMEGDAANSLNSLQLDSMRMIVGSGDLLRAIVDDVLDYSKLETTGQVEMDLQRRHLQQTLSVVVHSVEMRGMSTGVSLKTHYDPLIPEFIKTDARRVQQILYNILGNAVKFSQKNGTVELHVSISDPGFKPGSYSPSPDQEEGATQFLPTEKMLRFVVKDYGKGLDKEDYPRIFQPFKQVGEQVDHEHHALYGGSGLGLPITVKLIHGFGGRISVGSEKGEWTEFCVDLPFHDAVVDTQTAASGLKDAAVLLVTSEVETRDQVVKSLETYLVACDVFSNMDEVSKRLESSPHYLRNSKSAIVLVQEHLFDEPIMDLLSRRTRIACMTYGSSFSVREANGHHRSLTKMLPSALVSSMIDCLASAEEKVREASASKLAPSAALPDTGKAPLPRSASLESDAPYCALRYLIAEDNMVNQKVLRSILERLGIRDIEVVDNGRKAVDREAERPFDVVLMDMQMPVMSGIDACRLIQERRGGHARAQIIFVTAHVQDAIKEDCLRAGASGYLAKPCTLARVKECLESFTAPNGDKKEQ